MFTCIITGSNNNNLIRHTLNLLINFNVKHIIVVTNQSCSTFIQQEYQLFDVLFSRESFLNRNEACNYALQYITTGRIHLLESGATPTEKSIEIHRKADQFQVVCGLFTRVYDFDKNYKNTLTVQKPYKISDFRLHASNKLKGSWMLYANNNSSMDVSGVRQVNGFDAYFCVEGVTENADLMYSLNNIGFDIKISEEANIESYTVLDNSQLQCGKLKTLYVWFTDRCNYHCKMCRIGQRAYSTAVYKEPSLEEMHELILKAQEIGISKIELFGGEMLMRKELLSVIEFCNHHNIEIGFVSNGSLITSEISKQFFHLGVKDIPISLDAPVSELNNWIRGMNTWNKTMEGIENLKKYNNTFSIFNVIMKQNYKYMSDMIRLAKKLGAKSVSFQPVSSRQGGLEYSELAINYSDIPELKRAISLAFKTAEQLNIPIRSQQLVKTIPEYFLRDEKLYIQKGCTLPLSEAVITKTNKLQLCFSLFGPKELYRKANWLNFESAWESASYQELQKMAITGQCPGCLANCSDLNYLFNSEIGSTSKKELN